MIINTNILQGVCKQILEAVDTSAGVQDVVNETLELETIEKKLYLNVTNKEYYVSVAIDLDDEVKDFKAVVEAQLFLSLIAKITTKEVELIVDDNTTLIVKGNGTYKLPMIYDIDDLVELPKIEIHNVTSTQFVSSDILNSILTFNSKEVNKNVVMKPVQKLYYLDENGCFTWTPSSSCINSFTLTSPIKILLNNKLVKLFKLFKSGDVTLSLGFDEEGSMVKQKVRFEKDNVSITSIISNDTQMLNSASGPATQHRKAVGMNYPYNAVFNRVDLIESINRILLFSASKLNSDAGKFVFTSDYVTISDIRGENVENVNYSNTKLDEKTSYETIMDLNTFKATLEGCQDTFITLSFGANNIVVITRGNVKNVIAQMRMR